MSRRPVFITIEGIDGAGKSTHLAAMAQRLQAAGATVCLTREPGGTPLAEDLRAMVLNRPMDPLTEALLVFAARRDHVLNVIQPALQRGEVVLADRFADASFAYQGGGRGVPLAQLNALEAWACEGLQPDLTLWFDLDPTEAAQRRARAREADRFEAEDLAFFERVRAGYAARAAAQPARFARLDAGQSLDTVAAAVRAVMAERGW
ncbi:dTMP kinase [Inhella crocodyli]|uniref:Thymidylate kinase n=1 Tax=Inhella crocodyli TaxID=2499851 RepID=A0A3S2UH32_9BURK|nr:dTMP kinase [Inhella crocodyli]RVT87842.1 dTMP kinase [Inhella crocodyli]